MSALLVVAVSAEGCPPAVVDVNQPVVAADDLGLTRGDGCFEGLRLVRQDGDGGGVVVPNLEAHLARLQRSARALELPEDPTAWARALDVAAQEWAGGFPEAGEAAVKLSVTRGRPQPAGAPPQPTVVVTVSAMDPGSLRARREGIAVASMTRGYSPDAFAGAPWLLGGVKTLSYAVHTSAQREAARRGAHDALFVAADGSLLEAPTASVLWVPGPGMLRTVAARENGILGSTTQHLLFERAVRAGWRTEETTGTLHDLRDAHLVLFTSAVRGPVRVVQLDGEPVSQHAGAAALTAELQALAGF
ncbi:4-amino-4-deoxychorismate lyase [Quadrisphaera granulorum]|uniref:4-amino-4-deoxychorismate lyase n=1 Tax=Quadrisphaera granulorum TaxID=317664 RepID=A0A315ZNQ8_9ACTN|nr:aminotransferase class IV [Quadrisphaera granulorum]PWJ47211.1 4-amino-4-deoxychorismate lyase [Quadrisphaera granulorum]SZE98897.1 4-amino-4-deoxychorismate lyase [Quadrisphaera granulorum]